MLLCVMSLYKSKHVIISLPNPKPCNTNLIRAGLGLKEIRFSLNGDSSDFHEEIMNAFPKLRDGGDYELLQTSDGHSKLLSTVQSSFKTTATRLIYAAHYK